MTSYNHRPQRVEKALRSLFRRRADSCHWCDRRLQKPDAPSGLAFTMDHVTPKARGGKKTVPCCRACNEIKGDMMPAEWREFRRNNPRWWTLWRKRA